MHLPWMWGHLLASQGGSTSASRAPSLILHRCPFNLFHIIPISPYKVHEPNTIQSACRKNEKIHIWIDGCIGQDGQGGATWRCVEGKQATIWGIQDLINSSAFSSTNSTDGVTHASATNILSTAIMKEVHLLEHKSTFKVPLGVVINCLPSHEMTSSGEAFCYTVLPDSSSSVPLKLFQSMEDNEESVR